MPGMIYALRRSAAGGEFSERATEGRLFEKHFANVYLKDVIERNRIQNDAEINILVDVLASAIGARPTRLKLQTPLQASAR